MVGGPKRGLRPASSRCSRRWRREDGYAYLGPSGAGHFAKMVHNGIEYGMLQAYAEGFDLLQAADFDYDLRAGRGAVEQRQRRALLAAGAGARALRRTTRSWSSCKATSTTPAKGAGRCRRRSSAACRRR